MKRVDLDPSLSNRIFTVARGAASGIPRTRMRARDLDTRIWGVRAPRGHSDALRGRCAMLAVRLPDSAYFSHVTAARLLGIPLPIALTRDPRIHVGIPHPSRAPHAKGLIGHRQAAPRIIVSGGLRVADPIQTWRDLAVMLPLPDLVAAGDHLIHHRSPMCTRRQLSEIVGAAGGRRGARQLRDALDLLDERAESPQESILRCLLVVGGLPSPSVNHVIVDTETGRDVRLDLTFLAENLVIEYQGDYHRSRGQWRRDMTRRSRLEAAGRRVMEMNADDLRDPVDLVARVAAELARQRRGAESGR